MDKDAIFIDRNGAGQVIVNHELWSEQDHGQTDTDEKQKAGWIMITKYSTSGMILWAKPFGKK